MKPQAVRAFFDRLAERTPNPQTELEYGSPFQLLVAVVLSAQTTDKQVNITTRRLFAAAPTPETLSALDDERVAELINTLNLYRTKARHITQLAHLLLERHDGLVPADRAALEALPGVGRKTANVVLNTVFGWPVMAVDTHIFRLANRTGLAPGKDVTAVEDALMKVVPKARLSHAHHWLILHGRYVCTAKKPHCAECCLSDLCQWQEKTV